MQMSYALFLNDRMISGPFAEKTEAWAEAMRRGLVNVIPSFDEDPPRRVLDLNYRIGPSTFPPQPQGDGRAGLTA
jgi:hypothetical protein